MKRSTILQIALIALAVLATGWMLRPLLNDSSIWPPDDYLEYWAAGRLNLEGKNPYSPGLLFPLQKDAGGLHDEAILMWNPPWTLTLAMPLGALPAREGQFVWLHVQTGAMVLAAGLLWNTYGGSATKRWLPLALTFGFFPTMILLQVGQISGFIVLGAALFAWCCQRGYCTAAGAATVLLAVKPHLFCLLWPAIALDALANRRWRIVLGGVAAGMVATLIPMAFHPSVWNDYFAAYSDHPPAQFVTLTLGSALRFAFGTEKFWLQFVPLIFGVAWFARHWWNERKNWNWADQVPVIVLVSFVTAPYGAWHFDLVLLLVPVICLVAKERVSPAWIPFFVLASLVMLLINLLGHRSHWYGWVAPVIFLAYFAIPQRHATTTLSPVPA